MSFSQRDLNKPNNLSAICARTKGFARRLPAPMLGALSAALILISPAPALSQNAGATIEAAADALGMVRTVARRMDSINAVQFSATGGMRVPQSGGDWTSYDVTNAKIGMSYYIPAMRWDMTRTEANGSERRTIEVVRENRTWDEQAPGVNPVPVTGQTAERLRQIWLTPHGIIRAAVDAEAASPGSVTVGSEGGRTTLSVTVDGTRMTTVLNANNRPERVTMMIDHPVLGRTALTASYSGYIDWQILDVYFPSRIVQTLGDETTLDLTVTEYFQNPYIVFPTPEQLARSSQ